MGMFSFLNPALDFVFGPLLKLKPLWAVMIISMVIAILIVLIYKYTTKQHLMKELKDEIKSFQKQMKELRQHPEKALEVQKKAMQANMKYMMHSLKPMLITFIPIILIFGWLNAHLAYLPISPGHEFSVQLEFAKGQTGTVEAILPDEIELTSEAVKELDNRKAIFTMKAEKNGDYLLEFDFNNQSFTKEILITGERAYATPVKSFKNSPVNTITINYEKTKILNLGFMRLGWLGSYIIFSIVFSMILRKWLKVY